jgi:peptide/nickel transport system permease protein
VTLHHDGLDAERDAKDSVPAVPGMMPMGEAGPEFGDATEARSQWDLILRRFLHHKLAVGALIVLVALYLIAILAPELARYPLNPKLTPKTLLEAKQGPSLKHWFGTDELGRDQLTRIMFAARVSLTIGLVVALVSTVLGTGVGAIAGYFGGWVEQLLMRVTDLFLIVPQLAVLAMAQKGLAGKRLPLLHIRPSPTTLMIGVLSILFWQTIARVVRGLILSLKEKEFVEAARASGASSRRIIMRHILPNIVGPIAVNLTLIVGYAILTESALSFLGFGLQPPSVSLGTMLEQSESAVGTPQAYLIYFPGLFLLITVLAVNFLGDGLRDALDPQSTR